MFHIYRDEQAAVPSACSAPAKRGLSEQGDKATAKISRKVKLLVTGYSAEEVILAPRLPFDSFVVLKDAVESVLRSLPGQMVSTLSSLQHRDADGDFVDLIESTFDPQDFTSSDKIYLRAKVHPSMPLSQSKRARTSRTRDISNQRALGCRDSNVVCTPTISKSKRASTSDTVPVKKARNRTGVSPAPIPVGSFSTPLVQSERKGKIQAACSNPRSFSRAPNFVFGDGAPGGRHRQHSENRGVDTRADEMHAVAAPPGGHHDAAHRPSWNDRIEPQWEEAEKRRSLMRRDARARILSKRMAAAASTSAIAKQEIQDTGGRNQRVVKRAKRDCRVTDARRQRLGPVLFQDPIGTPPSCLGKRNFTTFRALGRQAASVMKFVVVPVEEPAPKRARSDDTCAMVIPRGIGTREDEEMSPSEATPSDATTDSAATSSSETHGEAGISASGATHAVKPSSYLPPSRAATARRALRPLASRPGDIGFRGGSAAGGAIMRPPTVPSSSLAARRARIAANAKSASAKRAACSVSTTLTAAAAAKATSATDPLSWSGRLRRMSLAISDRQEFAGRAKISGDTSNMHERTGDCDASGAGEKDDASVAAAKAIMTKLAKSGGSVAAVRSRRGGGGGISASDGDDVESLQEKVALLKAASGLSDEELMWRMETSKPEANAYRIASAALERAEADYERLLWRQGQLEIARSRYSGKGRGVDDASSKFVAAVARAAKAGESPDDRLPASLRSAAESALSSMEPPLASATGLSTTTPARYNHSNRSVARKHGVGSAPYAVGPFPADIAARDVRAAAERLVKMTVAVEATLRTRSEVDRQAVAREFSKEAKALSTRAAETERELRALVSKVEAAVGQVESWERRKADAPEFAAEEAAREEAWSEANKDANFAALCEQRAMLPAAVWEMKASDIRVAAATATRRSEEAEGTKADSTGSSKRDSKESDKSGNRGGVGEMVVRGEQGVVYPSDLCVRLRESRPLHWLVSAPEDIACANFLSGEGSAAFTQLEGMDLTEMRAIWCVLPKEFSRDPDGKKAEWRSRFRAQLEVMVRQHDGAIINAGWDPVRGRRGMCRMPPLPAHRVRHSAYFYPSAESMRDRLERMREQHQRLARRKERLTALSAELAEAKSEVDSACADARSEQLRERYGAQTLRQAREAAKEAHARVMRERKELQTLVAEGERTLSASYPSLSQLESEAESIAGILSESAANSTLDEQESSAIEATGASSSLHDRSSSNSGTGNCNVRVPGAFSSEPRLLRRASAAAKKLTPQEERLLRVSEVQNAVSHRDEPGGLSWSSSDNTHDTGADAGGHTVASVGTAENSSNRRPGRVELRIAEAAIIAAGGGEASCEVRREKSVSKVKAAPEVLAFLTREYSARAAAAIAARTERKPEDSKQSVDTTQGISSTSCSGGSADTRSQGTGERPSGMDDRVLMLPTAPRPRQPPKPMSKSLAALVKRSDGTGGKSVGQTASSCASPLSFLDELKAKARAKDGGRDGSIYEQRGVQGGAASGSVSSARGGGPSTSAVQGGARAFLDELKARAAMHQRCGGGGGRCC